MGVLLTIQIPVCYSDPHSSQLRKMLASMRKKHYFKLQNKTTSWKEIFFPQIYLMSLQIIFFLPHSTKQLSRKLNTSNMKPCVKFRITFFEWDVGKNWSDHDQTFFVYLIATLIDSNQCFPTRIPGEPLSNAIYGSRHSFENILLGLQ